MTCEEYKALCGAAALGALDPEERALFDAHLDELPQHPGCRETLAQAHETASLLALALPPQRPRAEVWQAIEGRIAPARARSRAGEWAAWSFAAAALALLVWIGLDRNRIQGELAVATDQSSTQQAARQKCADELARAQTEGRLQRQALELLQRPGSRLVALAPQAGTDTRANVIFHPSDKQAFVVGGGLTAPSGKDYELWLIRGDRKIAAGLLKGKSDEPLVAAIDAALLAEGAPDAIAVTLEPAGGGDQPRGPIVLVGKI